VIPHPFVSDSWNQVLIALKLDERHFREVAMQQLREQAERIRADTGVSSDIHVSEGKPFAEIAARALAVQADLLVVGAHGENALLDP
jgi:nucleotide-binding universal stress UspA family protein